MEPPEIRFNRHHFAPVCPPRRFTAEEEELIAFLLAEDFGGRDELRAQLQSAQVVARCTTCPSIWIDVPGDVPVTPVCHRIPVEAWERTLEFTPQQVHVLLHVVHGYLSELEIYRDDLAPVGVLPRPASLTVFAPPCERA